MKNTLKTFACTLVLITSFPAFSGLIDFESTAVGTTPVDNGVIELSDIFMSGGVSVRFGFDTDYDDVLDTSAIFEQVSNIDEKKGSGFKGYDGEKDKAAPGYESLLGDFFLRQSTPYKPFGVFTILYDADNPVTAASGEIWDIDGKKNTEQFLVEVFNGTTLVDSVQSPLSSDLSLNGKPWTFGFEGLPNITKIEVTFIGSKTTGIGLAFNNFSPTENIPQPAKVATPSVLLIFLTALIILSYRQSKMTA